MRRTELSVFMGVILAGGLTVVGCGSDPAPATPTPEPPAAPPGDLGDVAQDPGPPPPTVVACDEATGSYAVTREPSNVLFLFDRSGSMHIKLPSNQSRWQGMKNGFFDLLGKLPAKTGAGLMLFPQGDAPVNAYCGIDANINDVVCANTWPEPGETARCSPTSYSPNVVSGLLSANQVKAMQDQVTASDEAFYWGTPLATALKAAVTTQRASTLPGAKSVILFTDGNPTSCDNSGISNDISNVTAAAAEGLTGELVRTYVIGLVDSTRQAAKAENLSPIAVAGGTKRTPSCETDNTCFYPISDQNFAADLKKVFEEISLQAFDCTFTMPTASNGADPSLIDVQLTNGAGTKSVARDPSRANGWDYLPNGTQIQLYGQACNDMKDEAANLKIVLGCKPTVIESTPDPKKETK